MKKNESLGQKLAAEIERIAELLDIEPAAVTKVQFLDNSEFKEWDLRKVGGLSSLQKAYFPQADKDLAGIVENKDRAAYIRRLEDKLGRLDLFEQRFLERLGLLMEENPTHVTRLDPKETAKFLKSLRAKVNGKSPRSVCTVWSDQHFGTNFTKDETNGLNEFNWVVAARRLGMLCEQIATFKIEKRELHEELVIFLLGDNIAGIIHNQEGPHNDLMSYQFHGTLAYYHQALEYLKNFYPKIRVLCQPGNHGRYMHKSSKDRAMQQKFDSFENNIFSALSLRFANDPIVTIEAHKSPMIDVEVQGHRIFATHGDNVFSVGNPGSTINLARISQQVSNFNSEVEPGEKHYEMFITGHVHHPVYTHVGKGTKVIVNGCLIGTDPFALSVGIANSQPAQALWETTQKYVGGDIRSIYVNDADRKPEYEKIIKPYNYEIVFPKRII